MSSKEIYRGRSIDLTLDTVTLPNGQVAELEIVHHTGGAAAVAVDDKKQVCLIRQYRYAAAQEYLWEIPGGKLDGGEPPMPAARRELLEEAGVRAASVVELGMVWTSPGVFKERLFLFLATDLTLTDAQHENEEVIEVHWVPLDQALTWAYDGTISDAKSVIGVIWAAQKLQQR